MKDQEIVGNTNLTVREFNQTIKKKTPGQLRNKIRLGAHLIKNFEEEINTDPRVPNTIKSLQQQIQMLERELKRRKDQGTIGEQEPEPEPEPTPFDQVIGVNTLKIKGKTGLG